MATGASRPAGSARANSDLPAPSMGNAAAPWQARLTHWHASSGETGPRDIDNDTGRAETN